MGKKSRKASKQSPPPAEAPPSEPSQRERVQVQREDFVDISQLTDANFEKLVDDGDNVWVGRLPDFHSKKAKKVTVWRDAQDKPIRCKRTLAQILSEPVVDALHFANEDLYKAYVQQARSGYGGGHFGHRNFASSFKDFVTKLARENGWMYEMAYNAYDNRLSRETIRQLVDAGFFQTDHIFASIGDDPENFFLMPAPHNVRFSQQSRQSFKEKFCAGAWEAVGYFVARVQAMQRKYGRY